MRFPPRIHTGTIQQPEIRDRQCVIFLCSHYLCPLALAVIALLVMESVWVSLYCWLEEKGGVQTDVSVSTFSPRKALRKRGRFINALDTFSSNCWPVFLFFFLSLWCKLSPFPLVWLPCIAWGWEMVLSMNGPLCVEQCWYDAGPQCMYAKTLYFH